MDVLHTTQVLGRPVRFFRPPGPDDDVPWHVPHDLYVALAVPRDARRAYAAKLQGPWRKDVKVAVSGGEQVIIAPHWMAHGVAGAVDRMAGHDGHGPIFLAYCDAVKQANDVLTGELGLNETDGVLRTVSILQRGPYAL